MFIFVFPNICPGVPTFIRFETIELYRAFHHSVPLNNTVTKPQDARLGSTSEPVVEKSEQKIRDGTNVKILLEMGECWFSVQLQVGRLSPMSSKQPRNLAVENKEIAD